MTKKSKEKEIEASSYYLQVYFLIYGLVIGFGLGYLYP